MHPNEKSPRWAAVFLAQACGAVLVLLMACGKSGSGSSNPGPENQAGAGAGGTAGSALGGNAPTGGRGGSGGTSTGGGAGEGGEGTAGDGPGLGGSVSSGGSVSAGSSAGGSSAGMAGSGGLPPLPLPDGCEARSGSETENSCNLAVLCQTDSRMNDCIRLPSGRWECDCEQGRVFEIEGAEGLLACAVMAELCRVNDPEGDPSCRKEGERMATNSCELYQACGRPVGVTEVPGARAWRMVHSSATCARPDPRTPFDCNCDGGAVGHYGLITESSGDACQPILDFCNSGETPTYDGPTQCIEIFAEESTYGCTRRDTCATPMRLTDEVSLARVEEWYSSCDPMQPTGSRCYCSNETEGFDFDLTTNPSESSCASAMLNCTDFGNVERRGTLECQTQSQFAGPGSCDAGLECSQPATVNGRELVARGRMAVICRQRTAGQSWWCSCASSEDSAIFELGTPSATGWEACTAATGRCQDVLPLFIGPSSGYISPPDPLPPE